MRSDDEFLAWLYMGGTGINIGYESIARMWPYYPLRDDKLSLIRNGVF